MANQTGAVSGIMQFSEDLATAEAPPPLPPGQYTAEIIGATGKISQTSGNPYAAFLLRIHASEYPADYTGDPDGITLSYNRMLMLDTQQWRYRWRKFNEATGAPQGRQIDLSNYIGLTVMVEIGHDTYEGETRAQITRIMSA